jgi:Tfp pilus assembly protein PilX
MKKQTQIMVGVLVLMTLLTVSVAKGQSASQRLTAKIPFEFSVGEQTLPAGEYEITIVNPSSDQRILRVRSTRGTDSVMLQTHSVTSKTTQSAKLVFRALGDRHFLMQAWTGVDENGLETSKSKAEKKYRNEYTISQQRFETIALNRAR